MGQSGLRLQGAVVQDVHNSGRLHRVDYLISEANKRDGVECPGFSRYHIPARLSSSGKKSWSYSRESGTPSNQRNPGCCPFGISRGLGQSGKLVRADYFLGLELVQRSGSRLIHSTVTFWRF